MRILVTGGAGFIGSNFIHYVLDKHSDFEIMNLDALTYAGNLENLKDVEKDPRYAFIRGNICDANLVHKLVKDADIIVHFAAESHVDRSILDASSFIQTNIIGTQTLLDAANKYGKRFHHVSTDEVFGTLGPNDPPFDENTPYDPRSPYSATKAASDHLVRAYYHTYGLPITISNCSNNYGPYHFPEKLIPLIITNLFDDKKIPIYGDGMQVRDWLYVEDHVRAIDEIISRGKIGNTYCIGGDSEIPNIEIAKLIISALGKDESYIEHIKDRPGHDRRYAVNFAKIKSELGWQPQVSFEQGLQKTIRWFGENENWWKDIKSGQYQEYYKKQYEK